MQEDKETFCNAVRAEVKGTGAMDTADNLWDFFVDKVGVWDPGMPHACQHLSSHDSGWLQVRQNLHMILCFSPVGDGFRIRARQFPALVNCVTYDWFHTWPAEVRCQQFSFPVMLLCVMHGTHASFACRPS